MREVTHRYEDPLDRVWIGCAQRIGLRVVRDPGAFATTDGRGTLAIATAEGLDADDCLAQMIVHELCHSLVQGPQSFEEPEETVSEIPSFHSDYGIPLKRSCGKKSVSESETKHGLRSNFRRAN